MGLETGPKGEIYPMFYTYCPALDQFVYSSLNKGLYPFYYLSANLAVAEAERRARPQLRPRARPALVRAAVGARGVLRALSRCCAARASITRSARSGRGYTMTLAHPRVREHYAEMMTALMREVPDLGLPGGLDQRQRLRLRAHQVALRRPQRRRLHDPRVERRRGDREDRRRARACGSSACSATPRGP
ncbi:MAG: hypothetical protein MZV64_43155 [Ignavibacteriales bacterium]|nr:hypothetical protein [Ignavibacteriales bacterium]